MSILKTWSAFFQSNVRMRGRAYHNDGRVTMLAPQDGEWLRAHVRGSEQYTVTFADDGTGMTAHCTCSHFAEGVHCKHLWATLLESESPASSSESVATDHTPVDNQPPSLPKARKRDSNQSPAPPPTSLWSDRLTLLRSFANQPRARATFPEFKQVCYVIRVDLWALHHSLIVELQQRQTTQSGWSKPRLLSLNRDTIETLSEPLDRKVCAQLLGASAVEGFDDETFSRDQDRKHSIFVLPPAVRMRLVKMMVRTARCSLRLDPFTQGATEFPLRWDSNEPWVLWLVGMLEDETLQVDVQLRRGDQQMSADFPSLIIGGPGGVVIYDNHVAPFDDRQAYSWAAQSRNFSQQSSQLTSGISVPTSEIPQFMDRLFRLPMLPEIDFPEELGISEESIHPIPYLSLKHVANGDSTSAGKSVSSRPILGSVRFIYGSIENNHGDDADEPDEADTVVHPATPGRFVCRSPEAGPHDDDHEVTDVDEPQPRADSPEPDPPGSDHPDVEPPASQTRNRTSVIRRADRFEQDSLTLLAGLGFRPNPTEDDPHTLTISPKRISESVRVLLENGWKITADEAALHNPGPVNLSVTSRIDWFELRGNVRYETPDGPQEIGLPEILAAARSGKSMVRLPDGTHGLLPQQWLNDYGLLTAIGKLDGDHLNFKSTQAALLDILLSQQPQVDIDAQFEQVRQRVRQFQGVHPKTPGPRFTGMLRSYQEDGLGWFEFLKWLGVGGILADDMGLGKTVQVLAMLDECYTRDSGDPGDPSKPGDPGDPSDGIPPDTDPGKHLPSLVVVPRSLVFNWIDEAEGFAPKLRVQAYTGTDRDSLRDAFHEHDVIVTSYGLMRRDIASLREHTFEYVVLDEAQTIKNPTSQAAKAVRVLQAKHRLALTGTPVENHLGDLWSIFEFLNPGMLGSHTKFAKLIRQNAKPVQKVAPLPGMGKKIVESDSPTPGPVTGITPGMAPGIGMVAKALRPFILRRTKKQVLKDLPEKTEQTIMCQLEPQQRKVYDQLMNHYRTSLLQKTDLPGDGKLGKHTMMVLEALLRLRQAACHPGLIDPKRADEPAAKVEVLLDRLEDLIEEEHKTLVFSQFTSMLGLVRKRLEQRGIIYEYLDGQTRDRKQRVERFQTDPECPVFLISLKAGGLGLNLTAAEYVFILDPWWNPATEAQAIDRTHRIGQTRNVFAYRLICEDTIEQRIAELQARKRELAEAIIGGHESPMRNLTRQDLEHLLS